MSLYVVYLYKQKHNNMKKYEKIEGTEDKYLKFEVFYEKGGMNYFNGQTEKRGYYGSVRVVERKDEGRGYISESFMMFSGTKVLLLEVGRKNDKKYQESIELFKDYEQRLKEHILQKEVIS